MLKKQKKSSLLTKYSSIYERNPKSRVFAPLAESYRKLGMLDDAFKVLRDGIKRHPTYVMGYIVLSHCYFDQQNYELAYNTIRPFVSKNLENISLQKLFAQICINLGHLEEALQTFKYLLLINPRDQYVSEQVKLLEDDLLVDDHEKKLMSSREGSFGEDEDEWVQVDFNQRNPRAVEVEGSVEEEDEADDWSMEAPEKKKLSVFKTDVQKENLEVEEHSLDDDYYYEDYDNDPEERDPEVAADSADPIITHTLVDLYIRQGHVDKAVEILESILELHPEDIASRKRLSALKERPIHVVDQDIAEDTSGDGDNFDLANLVEEKVKSGKDKSMKILENKLHIFLQKIKKESKNRLENR